MPDEPPVRTTRFPRTSTNLNPAQVVLDIQQTKRTKEQMQADVAAKEKAKKNKKKAADDAASLQFSKAVASETRMRNTDAALEATALRPDLETVKRRKAVTRKKPVVEDEDEADGSGAGDVRAENEGDGDEEGGGDEQGDEKHDRGDEEGSTRQDRGGDDNDEYDTDDPEYVAEQDADDESSSDDDEMVDVDDMQVDGDGDVEMDETEAIAAQIEALRKKQAALAKGKGKASKLKPTPKAKGKEKVTNEKAPSKPRKEKAPMRKSIQAASTEGSSNAGAKRKAAPTPSIAPPAKKKPAAAAGGVNPDWRKVAGVTKPPARSSISWDRTIDRRQSASSLSGREMTSDGDAMLDRFDDQDETIEKQVDASTKARKGAKTAQMGITLSHKQSSPPPDDAPSKKKRGRGSNNQLPFHTPAHMDLWRVNVVAPLKAWAGSTELTGSQCWTAVAHPAFDKTVNTHYESVFSADPEAEFARTPAVSEVLATQFDNWRSSFGREAQLIAEEIVTGLQRNKKGALVGIMPPREVIAERAEEQLRDSAFLYVDPAAQTGTYRTRIILRTFAHCHLRVAQQPSDAPKRYPFGAGALALTCAAAERAFTQWMTGELVTETQRPDGGRGKKQTFSASEWATKTASYRKSIDKYLMPSKQKQDLILKMAEPYYSTQDGAVPIPSDRETGDSDFDPRAEIQMSDDEPEESEDVGMQAGPSRTADSA
uniref:DUF6532 domain-containing protein n=1 Tax=Mycena chlorophos TaxID=658473 RepID=A0ABQ0M5L9_MYCCL|nr:predicted protein [Mycena chlorophos]